MIKNINLILKMTNITKLNCNWQLSFDDFLIKFSEFVFKFQNMGINYVKKL